MNFLFRSYIYDIFHDIYLLEFNFLCIIVCGKLLCMIVNGWVGINVNIQFLIRYIREIKFI